MKRSLSIILFLLSFKLLLFGQSIEQVTSYSNFAFEEDYLQYHEYDGRAFFTNHTLGDVLHIQELIGEQVVSIYKGASSLCEKGYLEWYVYQDKIMFMGPEGFEMINFLTGEIIEEDFDINTDFQLRNIFDFIAQEGVVSFVLNADSTLQFDMPSETFVKEIDGDIQFRGQEYLYYLNGLSSQRYFLRRKFNETAVDTIASELSVLRLRVQDSVAYFHIKDGPLLSINRQTNQIDTLGVFQGTMMFLESREDTLRLFTTQGTDALHSIFVDGMLLSEKDLSTGARTTLAAGLRNGKLIMRKNFGFYQASFYYDLHLDTLVQLGEQADEVQVYAADDFSIIRYETDGQVLFSAYEPASNELVPLDLPNHPLNVDQQNILLGKNQDLIFYYDPETGYQLSPYDDVGDTLMVSVVDFDDNYGLGRSFELSGESLYFKYDQENGLLRYVDLSQDDGLNELEIEALNGVIEFDQSFYFIQIDEGNSTIDEIAYDILGYLPSNKQVNTYVEDIMVERGDNKFEVDMRFRHIRLSSKAGHQVFDLKTKAFYTISNDAQFNLDFVNRETENFYIVDINLGGGSGRLSLQNKDDLNQVETISDKAPKIQALDGDQIVYCTNEAIYYFDGSESTLIGSVSEGASLLEVEISPDKKYIAFRSIIDGASSTNVFHTPTKQTKVFKMPNLSWVNLINDQVLIYGFYGDRYDIEIRDFQTESSNILEFGFLPVLLSTFGDEYHFYNRELGEIQVFDQEFMLVESIPNTVVKDYVLIQEGGRSDISPSIHFALINRSQVFNSIVRTDVQLMMYNPQSKTIETYFDCQDDLSLIEVIKTGRNVFCLAGNEPEGYQVYKIALDNYIVDLENLKSEHHMELYPNPASDILKLTPAIKGYKIVDQTGQILQQSDQLSSHINIKNLIPGMYFLIDSRGQIDAYKFVKID